MNASPAPTSASASAIGSRMKGTLRRRARGSATSCAAHWKSSTIAMTRSTNSCTAGKTTASLKLPVSLQIVLRALIEEGLKRENNTALLANIESQAKPDSLAYVIYTSGSTGKPKGVLITNDQFIFAAEALVGAGLFVRDDTHLLFLPFSHAFAQTIKAAWFGSGFQMIYAESWDRLVDNAGETGPTVISGVPRVFEKAFSSVVGSGMAQEGPSLTLFRTAMQEFERYAEAKEKGEAYSSFEFEFARNLVFPKIREKLSKQFGGRIRAFVSGGAPLAPKIACFFELLGFNLLEGYGLTETLGITSVNLPGQTRLGTVGRPLPGIEVKIAADGEILERGRQIMRGYLGMPEATSEVIDSGGWFHTGDIGELDADGYLRVTDRKKDLIKTSGGKYIAPQAIEGALKGISELISQVVVVGDRCKYVSVLVTVVEDREGGPGQGAGGHRSDERDASFVRNGEALHHPGPRTLAGVRRVDAQPEGEAQDRHPGIQDPDRCDVRQRVHRLTTEGRKHVSWQP